MNRFIDFACIVCFLFLSDALFAQQSELYPSVQQPEITDAENALQEDDADNTENGDRYTSLGLLSSHCTYNDDGTVLYTDYYRYTRDNRLRAVERVYPDGTKEKTSVLSRDGRINSLKVSSDKKDAGFVQIINYDESSRISDVTVYENTAKISVSRYVYAEGAKTPFSSTTTEDNITSLFVYNDNGDIIKTERKNSDGNIIEESSFDYDEDGNVVDRKIITYTWFVPDEKTFELKTKPDVKNERYSYEFDDDGYIAQETHYINGKVNRIAQYENNMLVCESYHQNGELFLKVFFRENKKVKEERYSGSLMTGIRIFE